MKFMVAFDNWILYYDLRLVNFPFSYWIFTCLKKKPLVKLFFFSKELLFSRGNINFLTNFFADQTDLHFQIPNLEIKFVIGTPGKFPIKNFISDSEADLGLLQHPRCFHFLPDHMIKSLFIGRLGTISSFPQTSVHIQFPFWTSIDKIKN